LVVDGSLAGLADAQVELKLDLRAPGFSFGVIGESSMQSWWKIFTPRFGKVAWRMKVEATMSGKSDAVLKKLLRKEPINVMLMETERLRGGVRYGRTMK
jgi:hypothetical protein